MLRHLDSKRKFCAELAEIEAEESKHVDWRTEISEQMTSSDMFYTTLPAEGDVNLENVSKSAEPGTPGSGGSNGSYSFGTYDETGNGGFSIVLDTRKYDTLKFTAGSGNATRIEISINGSGFSTLSSGTNAVSISAANRTSSTRFIFNAFRFGGSGSTGASISGTAFQRRLPVNAFVGLDDPEASSFIRNDPTMENLSPEERKKKLQDMLDASNNYLEKMFGKAFPGTGLDPAVGEAGDTPGVEIAGTAHFPPVEPGYGFRGRYDQFGREIDPKTGKPVQGPMSPPVKKVEKKNKPMVAHHEPQGNLIIEKKKT